MKAFTHGKVFTRLIMVAVMALLLASCATTVAPCPDIEVPALPPMDESFSTDNIVMDIETYYDLVNNLLIYEGRMTYYEAATETLTDYIEALASLQ